MIPFPHSLLSTSKIFVVLNHSRVMVGLWYLEGHFVEHDLGAAFGR